VSLAPDRPSSLQISVFCGSRVGNHPEFARAAADLGAAMATRGIGLVYGGASVGLMGCVADAVLAGGGQVVGVITESLADHEIAHESLSRLEVVVSMHERKARMAALSDAVLMLPGGFGTYEEFMETVTWVHLGIHDKPCGILNVDGFFDHLLTFLATAVEMGFIAPDLVNSLVVSDDPAVLLDALPGGPRPRPITSPSAGNLED
jgi:uncharacterized protein (TIGR00730 family)